MWQTDFWLSTLLALPALPCPALPCPVLPACHACLPICLPSLHVNLICRALHCPATCCLLPALPALSALPASLALTALSFKNYVASASSGALLLPFVLGQHTVLAAGHL